MKLLYAEDEVALSDAVVDILTYHKYIVDAVYNGEDAFDYAMYGDYDGVILDIMMPKKDGLQVLTDLRKNGYKKPILLLTAKTQVEDRIKGLDAGADDYLPKPFDMGDKAGIPADGAADAEPFLFHVYRGPAGESLGIQYRDRYQQCMAVYLLPAETAFRDPFAGRDHFQTEFWL